MDSENWAQLPLTQSRSFNQSDFNRWCTVDIVYIIGGSPDSTEIAHTYEVIGVSITTKEIFQPQDIIHAVVSPAAVASPNRLVVCGGARGGKLVKHCQLYSPRDDG